MIILNRQTSCPADRVQLGNSIPNKNVPKVCVTSKIHHWLILNKRQSQRSEVTQVGTFFFGIEISPAQLAQPLPEPPPQNDLAACRTTGATRSSKHDNVFLENLEHTFFNALGWVLFVQRSNFNCAVP